ncbi:Beta-galactosidase / Beta-glucosidase/6-phospho-beta-glucosidase [Vibrio vulnificus]|nr:Beta-galactosidase / Beta-glucosidase/6-phospho-beta-glucosidase [Vibrio vulnificus]
MACDHFHLWQQDIELIQGLAWMVSPFHGVATHLAERWPS